MNDLYGAAIGLLFLAGSLIAAYFKGSKSAENKAELKASKESLTRKAEEDKERNAKIKIMADNELLSRDELFASLQSKPNKGNP